MNIDPKKTLFLIDGSSILYRGYYGVRPLHTSKGVPVHAVYNFCRMVNKLIDRFGPEYIALVWDSPGPTVRHEVYADYKKGRQQPPSDLFVQKEKICAFADLIGIKQLQKPGWEADDLMYSLARDWVSEGGDAVFVTSDKDMGQAITDHIVMFDPAKDLLIDKAHFYEMMGFHVEKLPFYFAMLGDTSDNIPGVRGIGKKTALDLVTQFDSLDDLYKRIHEIDKAKTRQALLDHKSDALLSYDLFLLQYHPTPFNKKEYGFSKTNWSQARPLFQELEFTSLIKSLGEPVISVQEKINQIKKYDLQSVTTLEQLAGLCTYLKQKKKFALDTETDGVNPFACELVGISFCAEVGRAFYIPIKHVTQEPQLEKEIVLAQLKPILEDSAYEKYLHNTKFDQVVLHQHGIELAGITFDTLVAASLITKDWQRINLKQLSIYFFQEQMLTFDDLVKEPKLKDFAHVDLQTATYYSAFDAHQTFRLTERFKELLKQEHMEQLYNELEFPLIEILYRMELAGIYLDVAELKKLGEEVDEALAAIERQIRVLLGDDRRSLNLNSPKQLQELLFVELQLPRQKKSAKATGYSTDQEVLLELSKMHPVPALIVKYRELYKLKSTYIDALPSYVDKGDNKIHTSFSQTRTATGRLASYEPNMQNIPSGGIMGYGARVRAAFKSMPGTLFIAADYSQIELRVLAYLSQDKNLLAAFEKGLDIHREIASRLFDVPVDAVTHEQRQIGKRINFSILYGLTPYGLSKDLNIPFNQAKEYIKRYFEQYPGVSAWMHEVVEKTKEQGYVTTYWGRRRYIPAIYEKNQVLYSEAKRVAINTVAQGTAAEIMKKGMLALGRAFADHGLDAHMLLQIHDELLIATPVEQVAQAEQLVERVLESVVDWNVPLKVSIRSGVDWREVSK